MDEALSEIAKEKKEIAVDQMNETNKTQRKATEKQKAMEEMKKKDASQE